MTERGSLALAIHAVSACLMLVSFLTHSFKHFDSAQIQAVNASPYQAVAVPLTDTYSVRKPAEEEFMDEVALIKASSKKQIWPWIFLNRIVGSKADAKSLSPDADNPYFRRIKGLDLYNEAGALDDFIELWRIALRT